jgi:PAS domain S-box-containing protein
MDKIISKQEQIEPADLSMQFLRTLIDTIPSPLFFKDSKGRYLGCNTAFEAYLGLTRDQLVGRSVYDIAPKELADVYSKQDQALIDNPCVQIYEGRVKYADGTHHDVMFHKAVFNNSEGDPAGIVGVMLDISARKLAEQRLSEALELNQRLIGGAPIGVAAYRASSGQCVSANPALAQILGAVPDQLTQQNFRKISSWQPNGMLEAAEKALLLEEEQHLETQINTTFGKQIWASVTFTTLISGGEKHLLLLLNDITKEQQAKEALSRSEIRYRALAENLSEGLVMTDETFRLIYGNAKIKQMLDYQEQELLGMELRDLVSSQERDSFQEALLKGMKELREGREIRLRRRNDSLLSSLFSASSLIDDQGKFSGLVVLFNDITNLRNLEIQLRHAQKLEAVGRLAAGIAHEINTPTQFIRDNLTFLQEVFLDLLDLFKLFRQVLNTTSDDACPPELMAKIREGLQMLDLDYLQEEVPNASKGAFEGLRRVSSIVSAMKEFSHPGTGSKIPTDLNRAIQNTTLICQNEWKYIANLELNLSADLPPIPCFPDEFNQVILNLVINAVHAIDESRASKDGEKGLIRIITQPVDGFARITVEDSGAGIPAEIQPLIFDPFFTTKEIGKGSGQGLAIARSIIVDKHGGTLNFTSEPGRNTTFIISLPMT